MNHTRVLLLSLTAVALFVPAGAAHAAFGDIDRSYGVKGHATLKLGEPSAATAALAQSDGRVLVAGVLGTEPGGVRTGFVARLTAAGKLDSTYGVNGVARLGTAFLVRITAASDGTTYALTTTGWQGTDGIHALTKDGQTIGSFGVNGRRSLREVFPGYNAHEIAAQGSDLIVIGIDNEPKQLEGPAILTRLTPSGAVDSSFGTAGTVQLGDAGTGVEAALVVLGDGSIVSSTRGLHKRDRDGAIDPTFQASALPELAVGPMKVAATPSGGFAVVSTYSGWNKGYSSTHKAWRDDGAGAYVPGTQGSVLGGWPVALEDGSVVAIGPNGTVSPEYSTRSEFSILPAKGGAPINIRQAVGQRSAAATAVALPKHDFLMIGQSCGRTCNAVATKVRTTDSAPPRRSPGLDMPISGSYPAGRPRVISGTVRPAKGIKSVDVALLRVGLALQPQTNCQWLNRNKHGRRFTDRAGVGTGLCGKPIFLRASGRKHWSLKLPKLVQRDYEVYVRANWRGGRHNALKRDRGTFAAFTVGPSAVGAGD